MRNPDDKVREQVLQVLDWEDAHVSFDQAVAGIRPASRGARPPGFDHSAWELVEHIRLAQDDSLGGNYVQDQILLSALEKLGYDVQLSTINGTLFFQAAAQGDVDLGPDVTLPQREPGYRAVEKQLAVVGEGGIIGGGINGYLIDKKTADANNITRFDQLKDPKIAALFGQPIEAIFSPNGFELDRRLHSPVD